MFLKIKKALLSQQEKEWSEESSYLSRKEELEQKKREYREKHKKITTNKLLILFLFLSCTAIIIFTGWSIVQMLNIALIAGTPIDFSPLIAIIGAVVGEVVGYAIYAIKSSKENSKGGIVYDTAMRQQVDYIPEEDIVG